RRRWNASPPNARRPEASDGALWSTEMATTDVSPDPLELTLLLSDEEARKRAKRQSAAYSLLSNDWRIHDIAQPLRVDRKTVARDLTRVRGVRQNGHTIAS